MDDQIEIQKQSFQNNATNSNITNISNASAISNHTQQYLQFFQPCASNLPIEQIVNRINTQQITHTHDQFHPQLQARILKHDKNFNIVVFQISYSFFRLEISTIRTQTKSCLHSPALKSIGSKHSTIFFIKHPTSNYVAKCIIMNQQKKKVDILAEVIRQYSLLKIASLLGIAPPMCTYFGFDLFIHEDCIEFLYSQCTDIKSCAFKIQQEQIQNLKIKLRTLHSFKIIHLDIKPDNILFCHQTNQLVLIDFGFSKVIAEDLGFKSMTTFTGTMSYCSPEMTAISGHSSSFIDLYYNDIYSLQASLNELYSYKCNQSEKYQPLNPRVKNRKRTHNIYKSLRNSQEYRSILNKLMMFKLKYQIFRNNHKILKTQQLNQLILSSIPEILQYIAEQNLNKTTQKIYEFIVNHSNSPSSYFQSFLNIQEAKQQQINQLGKNTTQNYKIFQEVYGLKCSPTMEYRVGENIPILLILKDKAYNTKLFGQNLKQTKSNIQIMTDFCKLVDFLNCNTSLSEKIQLSQQFILHFQINPAHFKLNSSYPSLQLCLKYILQKIIASIGLSFEDKIPQIITNLVIIQALQTQQLVSAIKQIIAINYAEMKYLKMLFKLRSMIVWNIYKVQFSVKHECTTITAYQMIFNALLDFAMKTKSKQIRFVVMLILLDQRRKLPQEQIQMIAEQIEHLDTGDIQFNNLLKTHFLFWRMQNQQQSIYFYQFLRIIYQINQIDNSIIFHAKQINHFHIELFQLFETSADNHILDNIYCRLQRCFQGTDILKKYRLYYTYRPEAIKNNPISIKLQSLQNTDPSKLKDISYQLLFQYNQLVMQIKQMQQTQSKTDLLMKVARVFDDCFLKQIVLPDENEHKIIQLFVSNVLICKIYIQLYQPQSPLTLSILKHIAKLQQYQRSIFCQNCSFKSDLLLLEIRWRISHHLHNYPQAIYYLIKHIQLLTCSKTTQNQDLKFIFFDIRKIIQFITQQKIYTLQELKTSKNIQFVCQTIKQYKLHIYGLSHTEGLTVFSFQCWHTLVINSQLEQFFTLNNQILSLIHQYPDKHYVNTYQSYFQMFIKEYDSWWKHTATTVLSYLITNIKTIANNSLICLFFSMFLRFCHPKHELFPKMKYYICKDIDLIDKRARYITLAHFLTHFLVCSGTMPNKRERRHKFRKYASYIRSEEILLQWLERKMGIGRRVKEQRCVFSKKLRFYLCRFHHQITTK